MGQLRVQEVRHRNGRRSYTAFDSADGVHQGADRYLSRYAGKGSDRTYAYLLVDHLRWLEYEGLTPEVVGFRDLQRYMGAVGAKIAMPFGSPWRVGKRPYQADALKGAASCLKGFYLQQAEWGINTSLTEALNLRRLPTQRDRDRALLGHLIQAWTPIRWRRTGCVVGTRRCCRTGPGRCCWRQYTPPGTGSSSSGSATGASASARCAAYTCVTCIFERTPLAASAAGLTCTSAIATAWSTMPGRKPSGRGSSAMG